MPVIAEESVRQVLASTNIVDLIGTYVTLKRAGSGTFKGLCPFHPEKTPSFNVSEVRQNFHCFGCGKGGDAISFVRDHLSLGFMDAVRHLAQKAGVVLIEEQGDPMAESAQKSRSKLIKVQNDAAKWMHDLLLKLKGPRPDVARDYMKKRGLGKEICQRWLIGYAPEDQRLWWEWARSKGYVAEVLIECGLMIPREETNPNGGTYVRFRHRVMFPVRNDQGDVIAFSGRILDPDQKGGKYVNSPETPVFNKSQVFFGWDKTRRPISKADTAIICEGQIDLITAVEHGVENIVAPLGTAFTEHHARMLRRAASQVVLCFDADNAGYNAALKCYRMLAPEGVFVKVASLPPGEDPDSLIRKQGAEAFRQKISEARDFFDFQIDLSPDAMRPENVREKTRLVAALADNILLLSDKVAQDSAVNRCATRLNVPASDIRTLLSREARKKRIEAENRREATQRQAAITGERPAATTPGSPAGRTEEKSPVGQLAVPNPSIRLLIRLALSNEEVFSYLNEQASEGEIPWQGLLGGEILEQILSAELVPGDPASQGSFMARLPEDVRSTIAGILLEKSPQEDLSGAMNASLVLRRDHLRSRSELLTQQMRQPDLAMEQIMALSVDLSRIKRELVEVSKKLAGSLVVK